MDKVAPIKVIRVRKNFRNLVDSELKDKMRARDILREKARLTGSEEDWASYRRSRNDCSKETKRTKERYYEKLYNNFTSTNDSKNIYGTTKELLGWNVDSTPRAFLIEGRMIRKPVDLANAQLDHYEMKMRTLK